MLMVRLMLLMLILMLIIKTLIVTYVVVDIDVNVNVKNNLDFIFLMFCQCILYNGDWQLLEYTYKQLYKTKNIQLFENVHVISKVYQKFLFVPFALFLSKFNSLIIFKNIYNPP